MDLVRHHDHRQIGLAIAHLDGDTAVCVKLKSFNVCGDDGCGGGAQWILFTGMTTDRYKHKKVQTNAYLF